MKHWQLTKPIKILSLSLAIGLPSFTQAESESSPSNAMLVLDASGSMWGQIEGKAKVSIAKEVISDIVSDWDAQSQLGLMAYGHNRKGDCKDIEVLQQPKQIDKKQFLSKVNGLNPKGKTPLTASVKQAAGILKYTEEKAVVVLISDGKETCDLDPCEVAKELNETGVDFTAHVISFDVPEVDSVGLRCLAEETGGLYLEAKDAGELKAALNEASEVITDKSPIKLGEATVEAPAEVVAGSVFEASWTGPKNRLDRLTMMSPDFKTSFTYTYIGGDHEQSPSQVTAPEDVGLYDLHYLLQDGRSLAKTPIKVIPAAATVEAPAEVVAGSRFEAVWTGPKNRFDIVSIFSLDGKTQYNYAYVHRENDVSPALIHAPETPGNYELRYFTNGKKTLAKTALKVTEAQASVKAPVQVVAGSAFEVDWQGPKNKFDIVSIFSSDGKKQYNYAYVHRYNDVSPAVIQAPESTGTYEVRYFTHGKKTLAKTSIQVVAANASVEAPAKVVAGSQFEVAWTGPKNKFDIVTVFSTSGKKQYEYAYVHRESDVSPARITAPEQTGNYEVRYYTNGKKTLAKTTIEVIPATATVAAPEQVVAGSAFDVAWVGPKNKFDVVTVFSQDGKKQYEYAYVHRETDISPASLTAPEKPGQYEVRYYTNGKNTLAKSTFTVVPATATISGPAQVSVGEKFEVSWTGPQNKFDVVTIFSANGKKQFGYAYVGGSNRKSPSKLRAPKEAGKYEIRYYTHGKNTLASMPFEVTE